MPIADLPESVLFVMFLLMFVVAGVYPAWQRAAPKIRRFLEKHTKRSESGTDRFPDARSVTPENSRPPSELSDYDRFVFGLLAQAGKKGLSRKQIAANLHLPPATVEMALESLHARRLIRVSVRYSVLIRFHLSKAGQAWAVEQGIAPLIHQEGSKGSLPTRNGPPA